IGVACPKCGDGKIIERRSKKGRIFYGCDQYPGCDYVSWDKPTGKPCPNCESMLVEKRSRAGTKFQCPSCSYSEEAPDDDQDD
ncbi:MAG: topoisomerase, partial [Paenibacillus sp.]|nr:topoisomerase [Paenibacillus sp.]